jgi:hypothetical protein
MPVITPAQGVAQEAGKAEVNKDEKILSPVDVTTGAEAEKAASLVPKPLEIKRKDVVYQSAYHDVYHILSAPNPCSDFFGGPSTAIEVFNNLYSKLETSRLSDTKTGLAMSGQTSRVMNARTGANYRMFEKAVINTGGPFYRRKVARADPLVPNVGSFEPNTREARAAILLHELGHLVQGADGRWLLPNDGTSDAQSIKNTTTIETRCGEQIKELRRIKASAKQPSAPEKENEPASSN